MINVDRVSILSLLLTFTDVRTPFADMCAKEAAERGIILAADVDGEPAGFLCSCFDTQTLLITYAYTLERYRRQGVLTAMISTLSEMCASVPVRLSIKEDHEFYPAFESVCNKIGFEQTETVHTYICGEGEADKWAEYMDKKGNDLCGTLERRGYSAMSFADCPEEILKAVYFSESTEYKNSLDPRPFFDVKAKNMLMDISFACVRNGKLAAYVLATGKGSSAVIFEHISASAEEIGSGAIVLPFCRSVSEFYNKGWKTASYAMYDSNDNAGAFRRKVLSVFSTRGSVVKNFCREPLAHRLR